MDSKLVQIGMLVVGLFAATVLMIVLAANGAFSKETKSKVTVEENVQKVFTEENVNYQAWMSDETFFDAKKLGDGKYEDVVVETKKPASYRVSSIGSTVRVVALDEKGKPVTGRHFRASIEDVGKYTDDDRDGIIDIDDVSPGDYSVTIDSLIGYSLPEKPIKITVKAKIEYRAVADISYLIKTEEDIDAQKEDTAVKDAEEESSGSSAIRTVDGAVFGIDVSKYNGDIDWNKVKNEGVKFAIIRCGYRGSKTGVIVEDPYFEQNIAGATEAGIPVGVYFFTQAIDEREAVEEASAVMSLVKKYKLEYPVFIDSESAGGNGRADDIDKATRSNVLQAFCETIRSGNYKAGIYASKNWFNNRLDISKLSADNVTWLAQYTDVPDYNGTYQMWQYSSAGRIPGIEGRVDMNLSYLDTSEKEERITSKESDEDGQDNSRDM